ncbi:MAG: tripartite tricarboxylate transporter permease [Candidatus Woesearchaeota archaeon]
MFLEVLLAITCGMLLGIITGLTPGIHINLISVFLVSLSPLLFRWLSPITVATAVISMAVTHTFLDSIPSVFLGAPDSDQALNVLPGHRLLLKGRGYEAVMLTVIGSLGGLIMSVALMPLLYFIVSPIYMSIRNYIGYAILAVVIFLIVREKKSRPWAIAVYAISGCLGYIILNKDFTEPLFPLFSGLFGVSILLNSLKDKTSIPNQSSRDIDVGKKESLFAIATSVVMGWMASFMPGLGSSQAAIIGTQINRKMSEKGFIVMVGGLNTVNMVLSLVTMFALGKARNGAIVAVMKIATDVTLQGFLVFFSAVLICGGIATILASQLTKVFSKVIVKLNYMWLCIGIIALITVLVAIISKPIGLLILLTATALGFIPLLTGIAKNHLMGCLLVPVMIYFLF